MVPRVSCSQHAPRHSSGGSLSRQWATESQTCNNSGTRCNLYQRLGGVEFIDLAGLSKSLRIWWTTWPEGMLESKPGAKLGGVE